MKAALSEQGPGRFVISRSAAPSDEERAWIIGRREVVMRAMLPDPAERSAIEDRIHQFAFGFSQLRSLDSNSFRWALANFVEAVDHLPREAVCRACVAWNKRRFVWANPTFPPQAPELARAAEEMLTEMRGEERELRIILNAEVAALPPPEVTEAQRRDAVARWDELRSDITRSTIMPGRTDDEVATERVEMARANEAVRTRERTAALRAAQAPFKPALGDPA